MAQGAGREGRSPVPPALVSSLEKTDSYRGIASAMPQTAQIQNGFSRREVFIFDQFVHKSGASGGGPAIKGKWPKDSVIVSKRDGRRAVQTRFENLVGQPCSLSIQNGERSPLHSSTPAGVLSSIASLRQSARRAITTLLEPAMACTKRYSAAHNKPNEHAP
jgi:hypothetical protein